MIDPPWFHGGWVLPYQSVTIDELAALPVRDLADPSRCHLHIWTLGNDFLYALKPVIEEWGFRLVSTLVWTKSGLGRGNYWRMSHEILLTAVWSGKDDRFDDHSLRSWIDAPRGRHSEKPEIVRQMIEKSSPGPRLELFARKLTPGWYSWGHEVGEPLEAQASAAAEISC